MSKVGVSLKIDVTKIEKARLFKGQKGTYLDATVFIDLGEADQYGNHGMITQDVGKEERQAGTKGPILGNVKVFYRDDQQQPQAQQKPDYQSAQAEYAQRQGVPDSGAYDSFDDEIPFAALHNIYGG